VKWAKSDAKKYLLETLTLNTQDHSFWKDKPAEIWASDNRFKQYDKKNFCNNLKRLRETIQGNIERIAFDDAAVTEHMINFPRSNINNRGNPRLQGRARELLELDVAAGVADSMPPAQLQQTRPEYKPFHKRQWTKVVNKEKSKQREEAFWVDKRDNEGARRRIKRRDQQLKQYGI
jgi:hypothetical protein